MIDHFKRLYRRRRGLCPSCGADTMVYEGSLWYLTFVAFDPFRWCEDCEPDKYNIVKQKLEAEYPPDHPFLVERYRLYILLMKN